MTIVTARGYGLGLGILHQEPEHLPRTSLTNRAAATPWDWNVHYQTDLLTC
jgi:hypothetical protein